MQGLNVTVTVTVRVRLVPDGPQKEDTREPNDKLQVDPGKENFDVKAGRSRFVFIKEEGD